MCVTARPRRSAVPEVPAVDEGAAARAAVLRDQVQPGRGHRDAPRAAPGRAGDGLRLRRGDHVPRAGTSGVRSRPGIVGVNSGACKRSQYFPTHLRRNFHRAGQSPLSFGEHSVGYKPNGGSMDSRPQARPAARRGGGAHHLLEPGEAGERHRLRAERGRQAPRRGFRPRAESFASVFDCS